MNAPLHFQTSSFCGNHGCVAVAAVPDGDVAIRDSKVPDGAVLTFSAAEWDVFVAGVKEGEFDRAVLVAAIVR